MKITVNQLRRIIKEEVSRALNEDIQSVSMLEKICDIVGEGEPEDYVTTADIISKYLSLKSTVSASQRLDIGYAGVLDPEQIEEELAADLEASGRVPNPGISARKLVVSFGLDPDYL